MSTKLADDPATANAQKQLAEERKAVERLHAEFAQRTKGKPTPTQEENDLAALGAHILEHEDDGSGPHPHETKSLEAERSHAKPQNYQTRAHRPSD